MQPQYGDRGPGDRDPAYGPYKPRKQQIHCGLAAFSCPGMLGVRHRLSGVEGHQFKLF